MTKIGVKVSGGESPLSEISFIAEYLAPLASCAAAFGLKDDAALLRNLPAAGLVITSDAVVAGVHFFDEDAPADVAYKALAVNVSDLAAKAAKPIAYTMTLALPGSPSRDWAAGLAAGLRRAQDAFGIDLIGGDTVSARGAWWISITAFGEASLAGLLPRTGAKAGDRFYVTGTLGDSALGLKLRLGSGGFEEALSQNDRAYLLSRYLYPEPRLGMAAALSSCASASMDISDGLALDLSRLCTASGVGAGISVSSIPTSAAAGKALASDANLMETILSGGDDYEILAAVPSAKTGIFEEMAEAAGLAITQIGEAVTGQPLVRFLDARGQIMPLRLKGFEHF